MDMIKYDWNTLKNRMEYEIIQRYTYIGAFYAQLFARKTVKLFIVLFRKNLCYIYKKERLYYIIKNLLYYLNNI